jgi:hypothetical protein
MSSATFCLQAVLLHTTEEVLQVDCLAINVKLSDMRNQNCTFSVDHLKCAFRKVFYMLDC